MHIASTHHHATLSAELEALIKKKKCGERKSKLTVEKLFVFPSLSIQSEFIQLKVAVVEAPECWFSSSGDRTGSGYRHNKDGQDRLWRLSIEPSPCSVLGLAVALTDRVQQFRSAAMR